MPRSKTGKKREPVLKEALNAAVAAVNEGTHSYRQACDAYNVKIGTLHRHLKKHKESGKEVPYVYEAHNDVHKVFSSEEEYQLVEYLTRSARLHYGLPKIEVRRLAYQFAKSKGKPYPSAWNTNEMAGEEWLRLFMKRYGAQLSLRKPEATSLARSTAFNKANVGKFFENLKTLMERNAYPPHRIYNLDETGISTVHNPPKIVAPKGCKQIGSMTSGERGINITVIAAVNAVGNHIPPMMIFPRVNFKSHMIKGAPPGTVGGANPSGWSNQDLFLEFLNHFIYHTNATKDDPVLLVLDNHDSHVNVPVIDRAREAGVSMITFPPHTSHKLQPLDRTVFLSLKTNYNIVVGDWMVNNPGKPLSIYDVAELFGKAYPKAFTMSNITSGFAVSGVYPYNPDVFTEEEFLSSYVTDRPDPTILESTTVTNGAAILEKSTPTNGVSEAVCNGDDGETLQAASSSRVITPETVRPYPKAAERKSKGGGRAKGKTRILTDTPEKEELLKKKQVMTRAKPKKKKSSKRQLVMTLEESDESLVDEPMEMSDAESDGGNFWEEMENNEKEQEEEQRFEESKCEVGDFILVKLQSKKSVVHYVAEIYGCDKYGDYEVKYLKRVGESKKFIYGKDELFNIPEEDIEIRLPKPSISQGSERQMCLLTFDIDFSTSSFKVQ